jgi:sec-independent protein translocase protein TatA
MTGDLQPWHILIIVVLLFVLFGAKRMPDMARSIGQSLRIFKSEMRQGAKETEEMAATVNDAARPAQPSTIAPPAPVVDATVVTDEKKTEA